MTIATGERVLLYEEALAEVLEAAVQVRPGEPAKPGTETLGLLAAHGRVLAQAVVAERDQPPFARSTRDGYAVRSEDLPGPLAVVGLVRAGERWAGAALAAGEALEIMTGAPLPEGANAVLMVEHVTLTGGAAAARGRANPAAR